MPTVPPDPTLQTNPVLTPEMVAIDQRLGGSPPGAGGWTPAPRTVTLLGMTSVIMLPMVPVFLTAFPGRLGLVLSGTCGAIAGGCTWLAAKSAGPRTPTA